MTDILLTGLAIVVGCGTVLIVAERCVLALERAMHRIWSDEAADQVRQSRIGWWDR